MSKGYQCPVCGRWTFHFFPGEYVSAGEGISKKISPDLYICSNCGYTETEGMNEKNLEELTGMTEKEKMKEAKNEN